MKRQTAARWIAKDRGIIERAPQTRVEVAETECKKVEAPRFERVKPLLYNPFTGMMSGRTRGAR